MPVDSGLKRRLVADMFCDSRFESAEGREWFDYLNELAVWIAWQNIFTAFYKLLSAKRVVLFLSQRDDRQQALLLRCSPRSWCIRLFGGNFRLMMAISL
jgi:hypothetical protein